MKRQGKADDDNRRGDRTRGAQGCDGACARASGALGRAANVASSIDRARCASRTGRCITVDVNESEVAGLVAGGYLPEEARGDAMAIKAAIEVVISDMAFEQQQETSGGS
jgi:hypothetical protein